MTMYNEQSYTSSNGIDLIYMFDKSINKKSDGLIVVFSAFSNEKPEYNYVRSLRNVHINKLFILDNYGPSGCYYLGKDNEFIVAHAVCELIEDILQKEGISRKKTTFIGSSKGGFAALYFGLLLDVGNVIAGEPQIEVGNYLIGAEREDVLQYIIGETKEKSRLEKLNRILYDIVDEKIIKTTVIIHVGAYTYHFKEHIFPFYDYCNKKFNILLNIEEYSQHKDLVKYFPNLLTSRIAEIYPELLMSTYIKGIDVCQIDNEFIVKVNALNGSLFAWYVLKDGERIYVKEYNPCNILKFSYDNAYGEYIFVAFVKDENGGVIQLQTQKIKVNNKL